MSKIDTRTMVELGRYGFLPRNSLGQLPAGLAGARWLAVAWSAMDDLLSFALWPLCQNHLFVARRPR